MQRRGAAVALRPAQGRHFKSRCRSWQSGHFAAVAGGVGPEAPFYARVKNSINLSPAIDNGNWIA